MRTFDAQGRVIAQDAGAGIGDLAPITITATPLPPLGAPAWYSALLEPPTVYYVAAGLAFVAWMLSNKRSR